MMSRLIAFIAALAFITIFASIFPRAITPQARASTISVAAYDWAQQRPPIGTPYQWGGYGNPGYDCSGLVAEAYGHADGIWLPHSTYSMLSDSRLHFTWYPHTGDLAFFGTGHVELYGWGNGHGSWGSTGDIASQDYGYGPWWYYWAWWSSWHPWLPGGKPPFAWVS